MEEEKDDHTDGVLTWIVIINLLSAIVGYFTEYTKAVIKLSEAYKPNCYGRDRPRVRSRVSKRGTVRF